MGGEPEKVNCFMMFHGNDSFLFENKKFYVKYTSMVGVFHCHIGFVL